MGKNNNKPKLRFPGFTESWKQRKLGEVFNQTTEYVNPQAESIELWSLTVENGLTPKTDRYVRDFLVRKEDKYKAVRPNDIVYNPMNMTMGAIGYNNMSKTVAVSGYYVTMKPTDLIDGYYIKTWMQRPHSINLYKMCATGSLIEKQRVQYPTFAEINFTLPEIEEQKKIGVYFRNIDNLIILHQRKLNHLQDKKKSLLQKMFPKNGGYFPELRFPEFTDPWEQRKLEDVIDGLYNGQTPSRFRDDFWNGNINWLSSGELNRFVVTTTSEKITVAGQNDANLRIVPKNTFVMAITGLEAAGTRGNCGILGIDTTLNQSCMAIFPNKKLLNTQFLFQWYKMVGEDYGIRFTQGTKQQSYNAEIIKNLDICLPEVEEQLKISELLSELDNLITLHQRKLNHLQKQKKALLQQMFV